MWKESYRLGVEEIDEQHQELFSKTAELLQAIKENAGKEAYKEIILFLKDYVVYHFADEEKYQISINYPDFKKHQQTHQLFTNAVLVYEKKLIESDFDIKLVKDLAGTVTAWLIHHVVKTDQTIVKKAQPEAIKNNQSYLEMFVSSSLNTLQTLAGIQPEEAKIIEATGHLNGPIVVNIELLGDVKGYFTLEYTHEFALNIVQKMTTIKPEEVDELVISALAEITNISTACYATDLGSQGLVCNIKPPQVTKDNFMLSAEQEQIILDTGIGLIKLSAHFEEQAI